MKKHYATKKLGMINSLVSRIGLGTVELGYTYGIGPRTMPNETDAIKLLRKAVEMGVTFFDTAHFYGSAEERIGKSGIAKMKGVIVATKCGHILDKAEKITFGELKKQVREEVEESRKKLGLDILPLAMYHGGSKQQIEEGGLIEIMQELKDEKKVAYAGISTRGEEASMTAIQSNFFDALQVPYSILDQRMSKAVLTEAEKNNIGIVARSVLLKGALTPAVVHLSDELMPLKENSAEAAKIAQELGMSLPDLAVRFALSNAKIKVVLVGTNNMNHIQNAVRIATMEPLPTDVLEKLKKLAIEEVSQVDPAHWPPSSVSDSKNGEKVLPHFYKGK